MSDGDDGLFPSYPRRREPGSFPIRPSDRILVSEIAKVGNIPINQAEAIVQGAHRRDVIHLSGILQREIPEDTLIRGIANIRDCSETEAMTFISEDKSIAEKTFREDAVKEFIRKYPLPQGAGETPSEPEAQPET